MWRGSVSLGARRARWTGDGGSEAVALDDTSVSGGSLEEAWVSPVGVASCFTERLWRKSVEGML